jgi:hypothetical protein
MIIGEKQPFFSFEILSRFCTFGVMNVRLFLYLLLFFAVSSSVCSQETAERSSGKIRSDISIRFTNHPQQIFGFDEAKQDAWHFMYPSFQLPTGKRAFIFHKSVAYRDSDWVNFVVKNLPKGEKPILRIGSTQEEISFSKVNDSLFSFKLPPADRDYTIHATYDKKTLARLKVHVFQPIEEKIIIVPLLPFTHQKSDLSQALNRIYKQAGMGFDVQIAAPFSSKIFNSKNPLSKPDSAHQIYTGQMRLLRDLYFEQNPNASKNAYYVFVICGFSDESTQAYMAKNKALAFIENTSSTKEFANRLAKVLGYGIGMLDDTWKNDGPSKGSTQNLMDSTSGTQLTHFQWSYLRSSPNFYAYFDNEENVKTNNGSVAYYFWEEDKQGNILFFNDLHTAINRPYKKNFLSYRFQVKFAFLKPFYKLGPYYISSVNVFFVLLIAVIIWFLRRKLKQRWERKERKRHFFRRMINVILLGLAIFHVYESLKVSNYVLDYFKQISGPIDELKNDSYYKVKHEILTHPQLRHKEENSICSEILIRKDKKWHVKKRMKVLYFEVKEDTIERQQRVRFKSSSDTLHVYEKDFHKKVFTHYYVLNHVDQGGEIIRQEVFTHQGKEISDLLEAEDPAKKIVLFVNGYRPTSIGHTFKDNFSDIRKNGLEFPNSKNYIYDFDRYEYWRPWNEINLIFQKRLNASEAYYADGHFSVSTSNYRSLLNFSTLSQAFPERCKNKKKHVCSFMKSTSWKKAFVQKTKTVNALKMSSNKSGFNMRKKKGRLAARNLLQILNEQPGASKNDTLFIVAHSMGFAYAQGMIEELRGKIKFGAYYIIAPENAKAGKVNEAEWSEIWQYGSNFNLEGADAPCLQDGVAPQSKVKGLHVQKRVFIPKSLYARKGFFDSHFIGYYTWLFDIPEGEKGHITKR